MFHKSGAIKPTIIDLEKRSNVKFLRPSSRKTTIRKSRARLRLFDEAKAATPDTALHHPYYAPTYAAGTVICTNMLESMLYLRFFSPSSSDVSNT
jgi:hypothetical protein